MMSALNAPAHWLKMIALLLCACASGCSWMQPRNWGTMPDVLAGFGGSGGSLSVTSITGDEEEIRGTFQSGIYTTSDKNTATMILYDGPPENPVAAVTIRMFWNPNAGRTPIDATATNSTIQYILFGPEGGKTVAIYSGAGYFYPNSTVGKATFTGSIWQSSLRISDMSEGFDDKIGLAQMEGKFTVTRDDLGIDGALHKLNVQVRERLGRTRLVDANPGSVMETVSVMDPDGSQSLTIGLVD